MPPAGIELAITVKERPQTHVLDSAAAGNGALLESALCNSSDGFVVLEMCCLRFFIHNTHTEQRIVYVYSRMYVPLCTHTGSRCTHHVHGLVMCLIPFAPSLVAQKSDSSPAKALIVIQK